MPDGIELMKEMKRVNQILKHPLYKKWYGQLERREADRCFCRHQMPHLMDVARIAYIMALEKQAGIDKEVIYATSVLHDIGKYIQYEKNIPHEQAGEKIAADILDTLPEEYRFSEEDRRMILTAIRGHRRLRESADVLEKLIYYADKASRMCFACSAEEQCNWSSEKKNMRLKI